MPRRFSIPFTSSTPPALNDKPSANRPASSRGNRVLSYFVTPKKQETQSAAAALQAASEKPQSFSSSISPAALPLPTISLSTARADSANMDEPPTTLFQPPSPAEIRRLQKQHAQFGPLVSPSHRHVSRHMGGESIDPVEDTPPYFWVVTTYISYLILLAVGHICDALARRFDKKNFSQLMVHNGYAPLTDSSEAFYTRRLKMRLNDCFNRPTTGVPGRFITLLDRTSDDGNYTFQYTGTKTETLNVSSYNYLGFAQSEGPCADHVEEVVRKNGITVASSRSMGGQTELHIEVEDQVAKFVGKQSATVFSMGFATNSGVFPALVGKGCLLISDELNHASIRMGSRWSGATIKMFKHNDMKDLEKLLRENISQGQPRTHRPWKKILVVVEGLFSMEGTMCNLPGLVDLKKRYKFNLFVDEAHSIGAIGPRGRGVCDYFGIDPAEVDILMGTLTKSFGANGGYIAADKNIIDALRLTHASFIYGESPSPLLLSQIHASLRLINGELMPGQGEERLQRLAFNSRYLRLGLKRLGYIVYGHDDSPIIPIMLYNPAKMPAFSREMLKRKISVVVVGYPATPLISSRARLCISAAHNKDDLDRILAACDEVGNAMQIKFSSGIAGGAPPLPAGVTPEMERKWKEKGQGWFGGKLDVQPPRWKLEDVIKHGVQDTKITLR